MNGATTHDSGRPLSAASLARAPCHRTTPLLLESRLMSMSLQIASADLTHGGPLEPTGSTSTVTHGDACDTMGLPW
jgi:hypothetical protein